MMWACDNSHADVVDYLLEHGADVNMEDVSTGMHAHQPVYKICIL